MSWKEFSGIALPLPTSDVDIALKHLGRPHFFSRFLHGILSGVPPRDPAAYYPGGVDERAPSSFIPAEALARQARLATVLADMERGAESREPAPLQAFRQALTHPDADPHPCVAAVVSAGLAEEAADLLRAFRRKGIDPVRVKAFAALLDPQAARAQARREASWQLDARRVCVRLAYAKEGGALDFDDGDLHAILVRAFQLEGLHLALDLGKRPRPMVRLELPLPAGAGGLEEWAEVVLRAEPAEAPASLLSRLNGRLPAGFRLHRWEVHPTYASPLGELVASAAWRWTCPGDHLAAARTRTAEFLAGPEWIWTKGGRVEGRKQVKPLDLRPLVEELRWEGDTLHSLTRMAGAGAPNPLRLHAAILGLEPAELVGLMRVAMTFRPDARLAQGERFEPKLKNIYEDAVLLGGGSNITLVEDDDDEPLRLG